MLYVQYVSHVSPGKMDEYLQLMSRFLQLVEKYGAKNVGSWQTIAGDLEEVTILECYRDMGNFEDVRARMEEDPQFHELASKLVPLRTCMVKFLRPTSYSPLQ